LVLGDVITVAPHNAKGNRESKRIMDLHEDVLRESGGSWDRPPAQAELTWTPEHRARRDAIIRDFDDVPCWGFKDPRTLITLDGWREALPRPLFVGTFRHPEAVARSLVERNGHDRARWLELWRHYNQRLIDLRERFAFPIVSFDSAEDAYRASVAEVARVLDLPSVEAPRFFESQLRHHHGEVGPVPEDLAPLYARLNELSRRPAQSDRRPRR
jgi:hypothetical protein